MAGARRCFEARFGRGAAVVARAPGRVNIIGEHIDYSGYGVLPMAIEQSVFVAAAWVAAAQDAPHRVLRVELENGDEARYPSRRFEFGARIEVDASKGDWANYVLCGLVAAWGAEGAPSGTLRLAVSGSVPPGAGLSSSSALVVASALAASTATGVALPREALAERCRVSEKLVGTEGGGMDQAISLLAQEGSATRVDFAPLRVASVKLPVGVRWVVANSLVEQHKQRSAATHFNRRVVECRLACALLARALGVPWPASGMPLGALQERLSCDAEGMAALARSTLTRDSYSMEDLRAHLGAPPESFLAGIATAPAVLAALAAPDAAGLRLRQRAEHVFSEAHRVERFVAACARPGPAQTRLLGALLNDSHRSCALGFECSCEELDALQAACLRAGALGARLTGAGWGGCVISLVPEERLEAFVAALRASFYAQKDDSLVQSALFITKPCAGASVER